MSTQTQERTQQGQQQGQDSPSIELPTFPGQGFTPGGYAAAGPSQAFALIAAQYFDLVEDTTRHARRVSEVLALTWVKDEITQQIRTEVMQQVRSELASTINKVRDEVRYSGSGQGRTQQ